MTRMKIGEFLAGENGDTTVEIIHDPKSDYVELVSNKGRLVIRRDAAYRLLGGMYLFLGLEPPLLPGLLSQASTWLRRSLETRKELSEVGEAGLLLVERLESYAKIARLPLSAQPKAIAAAELSDETPQCEVLDAWKKSHIAR